MKKKTKEDSSELLFEMAKHQEILDRLIAVSIDHGLTSGHMQVVVGYADALSDAVSDYLNPDGLRDRDADESLRSANKTYIELRNKQLVKD